MSIGDQHLRTGAMCEISDTIEPCYKRRKQSYQLLPGKIPRELHNARTVSLTKCRRTTLGRFPSSK